MNEINTRVFLSIKSIKLKFLCLTPSGFLFVIVGFERKDSLEENSLPGVGVSYMLWCLSISKKRRYKAQLIYLRYEYVTKSLFMKNILRVLFYFICMSWANAQEGNKSIAILAFSYSKPCPLEHESKATEYQGIVSGQFVRDNRFSVVERGKMTMIEKERELQKSEDFIDGKVVQQGVGIGADYMITGFINFELLVLRLSVYDVTDGRLIGKEEFDLKYEYKLKSLVHQRFIQQYFPLPGIRLVKMLEGTNKAESILIAAGSKSGLTRKEKLEIKELVYEEIEGESFEREVTLGIAKVYQIENENFTICKVEEGGKIISEKLASGVRLFLKRTIQ